MTARPEAEATLAALRAHPDLASALNVVDSLPALTVDEMIGAWRGGEIPTGHPLDGVLTRLGWYGKWFDGPDDVHPLVFRRPGGGLWSLNPAYVPMGLLTRRPSLARLPGLERVLRATRPLVATGKPAARLRMTEYRGIVSATMCYDALPIHDVFRRLDDETVLGVVDLRGSPPFVFQLERDEGSMTRPS